MDTRGAWWRPWAYDVVIVETEDVLLVCRRDRSQDVRQVVDRLKQIKGGEDYL